jgi:hypothetical protein
VKQKPKRNKEKERFWRKNLALLAESGLGQAEFCRRHNLNQNTLSWWKREICRRDGIKPSTGARAKPIPFVPLFSSSSLQSLSSEKHADPDAPVVEIDLDRRIVRIFKNAGVENLRALVSALLGFAP